MKPLDEPTQTSAPIAATSKSTTTVQLQTQQTGNSSTVKDLLLLDVPLLGALGVGTLIASIITGLFQLRIHKMNRKHAIEIERVKDKFERSREYEQQQKISRKELVRTWETLLDKKNLDTLELTEQSTYSDLESHFSDPFKESLKPFIMYALYKKGGIISPSPAEEQDPYTYPSDIQFRNLLKQELTRLKRDWGLI